MADCARPAGMVERCMGIDLDIPIRTIGRVKVPVEFGDPVPLVEADLVLLETERGIKPQAITRIMERHHRLAQYLANGMEEGIAAFACGYTPSHVSILKADPTFQELLVSYRRAPDAQIRSAAALLSGLAIDALTELQERLEDPQARAGMSNGILLDIIKARRPVW